MKPSANKSNLNQRVWLVWCCQSSIRQKLLGVFPEGKKASSRNIIQHELKEKLYHIRYSNCSELTLGVTLVNYINHHFRICWPMDGNKLITQEFSKFKKKKKWAFFPQEINTWCPKYVIKIFIQELKIICLIKSTFWSQQLSGRKAGQKECFGGMQTNFSFALRAQTMYWPVSSVQVTFSIN